MMAVPVFCHSSRLYLTGTLRFFSNSKTESCEDHEADRGCTPIQHALAYDCQLLASRFAEGLCPSDLARVALLLEVLVAFGSTEVEGLAVVANELDAMAWVHSRRAEIALLCTMEAQAKVRVANYNESNAMPLTQPHAAGLIPPKQRHVLARIGQSQK